MKYKTQYSMIQESLFTRVIGIVGVCSFCLFISSCGSKELEDEKIARDLAEKRADAAENKLKKYGNMKVSDVIRKTFEKVKKEIGGIMSLKTRSYVIINDSVINEAIENINYMLGKQYVEETPLAEIMRNKDVF